MNEYITITEKPEPIWPECFITGRVEHEKTLEGRGAAIADANDGWSLSIAGYEPPEKFGEVIVKLQYVAGCALDPDGSRKASEEWMKEWDATYGEKD